MTFNVHRYFVALSIIFLLTACKPNSHQYSGYIDADLTYLSSDFAGRLTNLVVHRGESVEKNQLLFKLEQTSEFYGLTGNQDNKLNLLAQRQVILNQLHYNEINYHRTMGMRKKNAASQNDLDAARKDLDVSRDQLAGIDFQIKASEATVANSRWQIRRKENYATDQGIIFDTYFTKGEFVQAGQPVLSLITRPNIKVIFFVSEKELSQFLLDAKIHVSCDGAPNLATGRISYIANVAQYTPPILYSKENRKDLVFRVEARIDAPNLNQIHLGQPVTLELVG